MSLRDAVRMTPDEVADFLAQPRTLDVATVGADGAIHIVAMWFGMLGTSPVFTTYGKSQKVVNLRRDPRLSGLVETGDSYDRLQGVELIGKGRIIDDPDEVVRIVGDISAKYTGRSLERDARKAAAKRVAVVLDPDRVISWDHRKLGATAH